MDILAPDIAITEKVMRSVGAYLHKRLKRMAENVRTALVKHCQELHADLGREHMSMPELHAARRRAGITTMSEGRYVILEEDGHASVIPRRLLPA